MADWTTAITIIGSFGAASTAQIVSHVLTNRREKKKHKRECLQNLYSPVVFTIVDYIEAEYKKVKDTEIFKGFEREGDDIKESTYKDIFLIPNPIFEKIIESVGENLKYAHPSLIMLYEENKSIPIDMTEDMEDYSYVLFKRIQMCRELLLEFIKISRDLDALSKTIQERFQVPLFFTEFYLLLQDCNYYVLAETSAIYLSLIKEILLPENNFLNRIGDIRKEISRVIETTVYRDEEVFTDANHFLHELIDEFSRVNNLNEWEKAQINSLKAELMLKK